MIYSKGPISYEEQIERLKNRGLVVNDKEEALHYLEHVGYYRLAGYWWPLQSDKEKHVFKEDATFSQVVDLYNFDRELRLLIFKVIEKVEISLRAKLIYHVSHQHGPWWFQNTELFKDTQAFVETLATIREEVQRSREIFMKEHKKKYKEDQRFPPSWKTLELTSFGSLSKLYGNLKNTLEVKDIIAEEYGTVNHTYLPSWLQSMTQIRNYCAHHARLWNRNLPGAPKLLKKPPLPWIKSVPKQHEFQKLYVHLCLMKYLLRTIQPENKLTRELEKLMHKYPNVDPHALGFKSEWKTEKLWEYL